MESSVRALIRLSEVDTRIYQLRKTMVDRPAALAEEERDLNDAKAKLEATVGQIRALQVILDRRQVELAQAEAAVSKMNLQLNNLKTNVEYAAMQKQIDSKREEMRTLEDRILEAMEVVENAKGELPGRKAYVGDKERILAAARAQLESDLVSLRASLASMEQEMRERQKDVPADVLAIYQDQLKRYGKLAVVTVDTAGICQGCHTKVTGQVANGAVAGHVVQCNNCERLIYAP
jgi:predicted  nucleic acid-binding Zn-ribbon protein